MASTAQFNRMASLLRDIARSGGHDTWSHLHSHGHSHATLRSAVARECVRHQSPYYMLTDHGREWLVVAAQIEGWSPDLQKSA